MAAAQQLTLAVLKPDLVCRLVSAELVRQMIINEGLLIVESRIMKLSLEEAKAFYEEHQGRFYFQRLTEYMSSDYINPMILGGNDAINRWRQLIGPTKTTLAKRTAPDSIRAKFGLTDTQNSVHGSDCIENALREIKFFFPNFCHKEWLKS